MNRLLMILALIACISAFTPLSAQNNGNGNGNAYGNGNGNAYGVDGNDGVVVIPDSSIEGPADAGKKSHTNHLEFQRGQGKQSYLSGLTPSAIAKAYNLTGLLGGSGIIAIVDAFHYPTAASDLQTFSAQYTPSSILPACGPAGAQLGTTPCFWQVYADSNGGYSDTSGVPRVSCGWNQEAALDIEWAHAMAPNASIVLVEAQTNSNTDLFGAVKAATSIIQARTPGKGQVSMSWGSSETSGETAWDSYFPTNGGIVFFAASGDTGGKTIYPGVSPKVVSAGGTSLRLTGAMSNPTFASEVAWSGSGGGTSPNYSRPAFQDPISDIVGNQRGVPDFSFDADPATGVLVYGPTCRGPNRGWMIFGGTSVSSPALAGIVNSAASFAADSNTELLNLYSNPGATTGTSPNFRDIISGTAGTFTAAGGWDFITGLGSPLTLTGK